MPRGQKTCSKCSFVTGPRTKICPSCGENFDFKTSDGQEIITLPSGRRARKVKTKRKRKQSPFEKDPDFNWKDLQPGDRIKVKKGSGPVWLSKNQDETEKPNYVNLGYKGSFVVKSVDDEGIHAYNISEKAFVHCTGHCYIYMGPVKRGIDSSIIKIPHEIRKYRNASAA